MSEVLTRTDFDEAVTFARKRLEVAQEQYRLHRSSLVALRAVQVANDEMAFVLRERREHGQRHDVMSLRQLDLMSAARRRKR